MTTNEREAVAIIGVAGCFPGAPSTSALQDLVFAGREGLSDLDDVALAAAGVAPEVRSSPRWIRRAGVLDRIDLFDADRFGITPREAELMDPQHRIFLETCHDALEDAGYRPGAIADPVGVFAGCGLNSYLLNVLLPSPDRSALQEDMRALTGNDRDYLATCVAYRLDLRGPAVTVQTACSTSLSAIHLAVEAILSGQCDMALAGGVCVRVPQRAGAPYRLGGILSADGRCRAFAADAAGTVLGNGAGVVVLKRLSAAIADGDALRAVILATAMSNDGAGRAGFTVPSPEGQARVIAEALTLAEVDARTVTYVEAHGTATPLGDRVEIAGLTRAFRRTTADVGFCGLGSVKTNIGHLDAASGVAGLVKVLGAFARGQLPPSLHADQVNRELRLEETPFRVIRAVEPWIPHGAVRRAGISSFGIGGTNVHVVLEEAPPRPTRAASPGPHLLCLSARSGGGLAASAATHADVLAAHEDERLEDAAFTLATGRSELSYRAAVVAWTRPAAAAALREVALTAGGVAPVRDAPLRLAVVFPDAFPGVDALIADLSAWNRDFAREVEACLSTGERLAWARGPGWLAVFAFETATYKLLSHLGVRADTVACRGIGMYAAAHAVGAISLEDAITAAAGRASLDLGRSPLPLFSLDHGRLLAGESSIAPAFTGHRRGAILAEARAYFAIDLGSGDVALKVIPHAALALTHGGRRVPAPQAVLEAIGAAWRAGVAVDRSRSADAEQARRTALPPTPAERRSFWAGPGVGERGDAPRAPPRRPQEARAAATSAPVFRPAFRLLGEADDACAPPRRCLLLGHDDDLSCALAGAVEASGDHVVRAGPDATDAALRVAPGDADGLGRLLANLQPARVLALWPAQRARFDNGALPCYHALAALGQALGSTPSTPASLSIVTRGLASIAGEVGVDPYVALALGAADGIRREIASLLVRCVDIADPRDVSPLVREVRGTERDPLVLLRGDDRWGVDLVPAGPARASTPARLQEGGVYVITGGLGALALVFARALAERLHARIALLSRSDLVPGDALRDLPEDHRLVQRARGVEAVCSAGEAPLVLRSDVESPAELRAAFDAVVARWGRIDGVIHAAGVSSEALLRLQSRADADVILSPKVRGTENVLEAVRPHAPRFVALCGSLLSLTGGDGQAAYCAANAFLDGLARARAGGGSPEIVTLSWDVWEDTGMAAAARRMQDFPLSSSDWVVGEHREGGTPVIPGAALLDLVVRGFRRELAVSDVEGTGAVELTDVAFFRPAAVPDGERRTLRVVFHDKREGHFDFRVEDRETRAVHARGQVRAIEAVPHATNCNVCVTPLAVSGIDARDPGGGQRGPHWHSVRQVRRGDACATAELALDEGLAGDLDGFALHPALLDVATGFAQVVLRGGGYFPSSIEKVVVHDHLGAQATSHARVRESAGDDVLRVDIDVTAPSGVAIVHLHGFVFRRAAASTLLRATAPAPPRASTDGGIRSEEGGALLLDVLGRYRGPHLVVSPRLQAGSLPLAMSAAETPGPHTPAAPTRAPRPALATALVPPRSGVERELVRIWEGLLNIAPLGVEDDFFELGGDSMIFVQFINAARPLGIRLEPDALFDQTTIAGLANIAEITEPAVAASAAETGDDEDELGRLRRRYAPRGEPT